MNENAVLLLSLVFLAAPVPNTQATAQENALSAEQKDSTELYLASSSAVLAAADVCDFRIREDVVRAFVAERIPDMNWALFAMQVQGVRCILSSFPEEQKAKNCTELHDLAASAGWLN